MLHIFRPAGLRGRMMLLVLLAVVPCIGLTLWSGLREHEQAKAQAQLTSLRLARKIAMLQENLILRARTTLTTLATLPAVQNADVDNCAKFFARLYRQLSKETSIIALVSLQGDVLTSVPATAKRTNFSDRRWFKNTLASGRFTISDYLIGRITGKAVIGMSLPVKSPEKTLKGVLLTSLNLNWLSAQLASYQLPPNSHVTVVDRTGTVLAHYPETAGTVGKNISNLKIFKELMASSEGALEGLGLDGVRRLMGFTKIVSGLRTAPTVFVSIPLEAAYAQAREDLYFQLFILLLVGLVGVGAAWYWGGRTMMQPIQRLINASRALSLGDLSKRIPARKSIQEIDLLAEAFNRMAEDLQKRDAAQKKMLADLRRKNAELDEFTYVASHDLQEPLRKLVSFSSLLRQDLGDDLPAIASKDLFYIVDSARRMQTLVQDLLRFSRASQATIDRKEISLEACVDDALNALDTEFEQIPGVQIERDPLPVVWGDRTLLTQLYQNLIGNAIKYHGNEPLKIQITCQQVDGVQVLGVSDNGIGIDPAYHKQIFEPFKRLHRRDEYDGSGIGLSICRKTVDRHGGAIWCESELGKGTHFMFTLMQQGAGAHTAGNPGPA